MLLYGLKSFYLESLPYKKTTISSVPILFLLLVSSKVTRVILIMPLVLRTVEPKYLSRQVVTAKDDELEAVTNNTLSNVLRQLASLVLLASEIFEGLAEGLQTVHLRSCSLRTTIDRVETKLAEYNPRTVTVRKYFLNFSTLLLLGIFS